jgi:Uma2 family endonuclease
MISADSTVGPEDPGPVVLKLLQPVTETMLLELSARNPEYRFETMADGRLVVSFLTGMFAARGEAELIGQLFVWNKQLGLGSIISSNGGVTLADGAIKGPDATFISKARLAGLPAKRKKRAFEQIAPDAVFELLSPSDRLAYTVAKCREYVDTGSDVAVLLDPRERSVTLYRKHEAPTVVRAATAVVIGAEMPGFTLDAAAVFDACDPA